MKFGQIKCTNCGADLEVDLDKGFAICPYCENKMYANYSDDLLIEKEKTKQKIYELGKEIEKTRRSNASKSSYIESSLENDFPNIPSDEEPIDISNISNFDKELDNSIDRLMILLIWLCLLFIFHFVVFDNIFNY